MLFSQNFLVAVIVWSMCAILLPSQILFRIFKINSQLIFVSMLDCVLDIQSNS